MIIVNRRWAEMEKCGTQDTQNRAAKQRDSCYDKGLNSIFDSGAEVAFL